MTQSMIIPSRLTTELDAVNVLIRSIGEEPYASLVPSPGPDADKALGAIQEEYLSLLTRGWHWNREYALPLTLASDSTVAIPENALEVTRAYFQPQDSVGNFDITDFDVRTTGSPPAKKLYDLVRHTFTFEHAPYVDMLLIVPWCDLPQAARRVITLEAAQRFQAGDQASSVVFKVNEEDLIKAWTVLEQQQDRKERSNAVYGNRDTLLKLFGNRGMRRNRGNY